MKIRLVFIFAILGMISAGCNHPYSEMKEGRYVGSDESNHFGYIRHFVYLQESHNGNTVEKRYEVPDSVYWKLNHYHYGTYIKIEH